MVTTTLADTFDDGVLQVLHLLGTEAEQLFNDGDQLFPLLPLVVQELGKYTNLAWSLQSQLHQSNYLENNILQVFHVRHTFLSFLVSLQPRVVM